MVAQDFRTFLEAYEAAHPELVVHVWDEVSAKWEASAIGLKAQKELKEAPLFIFHRLRTVYGDISPFPVVVNLFASRQRCAFAVNSGFERLGRDLHERRGNRVKPTVVGRADAPVKQVVTKGDAINLNELPAVVHAAWDPGPYVSAGFLTTYDPETGTDNTALQRGWLFDEREIRIFPNPSSHNGWNIRKLEGRGEDPRVAFWVGHHPGFCIGAESKLGYPESHWEVAGGIMGEPLRLVPSETLGDDFLVPADAEFVIEGIVPRGKRKPEGPFGEYTRYFGGQRLNPYMEVTCVTRRENPYWFTIITGYGDDGIGGLRREGSTFDLIKRVVPQITSIHRPPTSPFYMYIQLKKTADWQPRAIISAAISNSDGIKYAFVFDDDVDIFDEREALWAISTRSQWDRDLIVCPGLRAHPLDPSVSVHGVGTKAALDCTRPAPPEPGLPQFYSPANRIPDQVMEHVKLESFIPPELLQAIPTR